MSVVVIIVLFYFPNNSKCRCHTQTLNFMDITSEFCSVPMCVVVALQTIFHAYFVDNTTFYVPDPIGSMFIAMKPTAKECFLHCYHIIILNSMKIHLTRKYIFFHSMFHIISGSLSKWH